MYGDVAVFVHPLALAIFSAHACFMLTMHTRRGWMTPERHALGALLLEQGRVAEAAQAYREDLAPGRHPENVWALHGLVKCLGMLEALGTASPEVCAEHRSVVEKLHAAQADADFEVRASCACATHAWNATL